LPTISRKDFAAYHGAKYGVLRGTEPIVARRVVALQLRIKFGDEVIAPALHVEARRGVPFAVHSGFVDVDPDTYCLDVDPLRTRITP